MSLIIDKSYERRATNPGFKTKLTPDEQAEIIDVIEHIEDPEEQKRAICNITDAVTRHMMVRSHLDLFEAKEQREKKQRESLTLYTPLADGSYVERKLSDEESDEVRRREIVTMTDKGKRTRAIKENLDLFD